MRGVPLCTIGEMVGHTNTEMTKRYAHLCPDTGRQAISHVEEMAKSCHPAVHAP
jgi:hypothetical protein